MIAALFVETDGVYFGLPDIDPWDETRDARLYAGPWPVIAHPPCARWGRYWGGGPSASYKRELGADHGCFRSAISAVRKWGGVLEHPADTYAWSFHHIASPPRNGGWIRAGDDIGWTCCVEQGNYGHRARKATWLYIKSKDRPRDLKWGKAEIRDKVYFDEWFHSAEERRRAVRTGVCQRLSKKQRAATPIEFRNLLISLVCES